jgi:hypothetical protein
MIPLTTRLFFHWSIPLRGGWVYLSNSVQLLHIHSHTPTGGPVRQPYARVNYNPPFRDYEFVYWNIYSPSYISPVQSSIINCWDESRSRLLLINVTKRTTCSLLDPGRVGGKVERLKSGRRTGERAADDLNADRRSYKEGWRANERLMGG